jgi:hypothetical protein
MNKLLRRIDKFTVIFAVFPLLIFPIVLLFKTAADIILRRYY